MSRNVDLGSGYMAYRRMHCTWCFIKKDNLFLFSQFTQLKRW